MGRRTAVWKAALWGGIAGTLPDLDVLIDHGDPVLNMVRHRAESHSFFYLTLFSPLLAWLVTRIHGDSALFKKWWLALWLVLITHPILDTMTVYGTQLLMPFTDYPFAIGSVFIIDPAYTVPLIMGVVAALRLKNDRGLQWNAAALVLSTLYLGWSVLAQQHVERIARSSLGEQGISTQGLLVTPAPFNTVLWRLVAISSDQYIEGYYSLLDEQPTVTWAAYPRDPALVERFGANEAVARIASFSHGFFSLSAPEGRLWLTDLRMGQEPAYVFRFDLGALSAVGQQPPQQMRVPLDFGRALPWLWNRIQGQSVGVPMLDGS